ncbi:MAG TPA: nicotinate (nicotinamide) nucleotide adenylyltransferase [Candidatus Polarisedimenticolaceae bacterium]|nr:nicotinate (nicotinamide) nucleotide adenylyltransferase [Candidatus Polarisedimenticolaceae bacterium]
MTAAAILGGSFDPVHRGHIVLAAGARRTLGVERVFLLPCAEPTHKPGRRLAARYHRLEMLALATEGVPGLAVSTFEIARGGHRYTIDTLRALREEGLRTVFLVGSDALAELDSWRDYTELLAEFDFGVVERPDEVGHARGATLPEAVRERLHDLPATGPPPGKGGRIFRLAVDTLPVSSSLVRQRRFEGRAIGDLVPPRVARYIQRHGLYEEEAHR